MMQFYFLSVLSTIVGGLIMASDFMEKKFPIFGRVTEFFVERANFKLFIGLIAGIVGIIKLLLPVAKPYVLGDLLPGLAGILVGFGLIIEYYQARTDVPDENQISSLMEKYKHIIGLASMALGILHFFMPGALFL